MNMASCFEHSAEVSITYSLLCKSKRTVLLHFTSRSKKYAQGGARESAADADSLNSNR